MKNVLFLDIDGTLLSHQTFSVPESALEAVGKARRKGCDVYLCTGRSLGLAEGIMDSSLYDGIIFCNGAAMIKDGRILFSHPIPEDAITYSIQLAQACHAGISLFCDRGVFRSASEQEFWKKRMEQIRVFDPAFLRSLNHRKTLQERKGEPIYKMDVRYFKDSDRAAFEAGIHPSLLYVPVLSEELNSSGGGEITRKGVSKGSAVKLVMMEYPGWKSWGFGDSLNDLEMLKACDEGIAMGNGDEKLKAQADHVCGDIEEDGLARAFKAFSLI